MQLMNASCHLMIAREIRIYKHWSKCIWNVVVGSIFCAIEKIYISLYHSLLPEVYLGSLIGLFHFIYLLCLFATNTLSTKGKKIMEGGLKETFGSVYYLGHLDLRVQIQQEWIYIIIVLAACFNASIFYIIIIINKTSFLSRLYKPFLWCPALGH